MIDKQKIREKHLNLQGLSVNKGEVGKRIQKATFDAMDEFSKEIAIGFAKWCNENTIQDLNSYERDDLWCMEIKGENDWVATEQLFKLYLQSTKQ